MAWIKRNLYFVIGSLIALALMGLAGYFLYSGWSANNQILGNLNEDYEKLRRLNSAPIHPGSGQVDNIKLAKEQREQLRDYLKKPRAYFQPIAPIPNQPKLSDQDFTSALSHTLDQLQKDATNASVSLPPNYAFSFEAQRPRVMFAAGSLPALSVQLGEVKAISDILFSAKINSLDNIRRERVSADDSSGPQTDYIPDKSVTNELAILTPYELTFRSFSSELAAVLSAFASSSNGFIVKTINVEPAPAAETGPTTPYASYTPAAQSQPDLSQMYRSRYGINPGGAGGGFSSGAAAAAYASRYGGGGGASRYGGGGAAGANLGGIQYRPLQPGAAPTPAPSYTPPPTGVPGQSAAGHGALAPALDEKQLKVTMALVVVKLLPPK